MQKISLRSRCLITKIPISSPVFEIKSQRSVYNAEITFYPSQIHAVPRQLETSHDGEPGRSAAPPTRTSGDDIRPNRRPHPPHRPPDRHGTPARFVTLRKKPAIGVLNIIYDNLVTSLVLAQFGFHFAWFCVFFSFRSYSYKSRASTRGRG